MAKKGVAQKMRLISSGKTEDGRATGYTYYFRRGRQLVEKMVKRKYDPRAFNKETGKLGMHVEFKEKKLPPHKKN